MTATCSENKNNKKKGGGSSLLPEPHTRHRFLSNALYYKKYISPAFVAVIKASYDLCPVSNRNRMAQMV